MAKKQKNDQSQALLSAIRTWASTHNLYGNPLLNKLVEDIESKNNLKIWADMDPNKYIPLPDSSDQLDKVRRINTITGIRNILVFSPVAITWAAISVVTSAFSRYEQANPNSIVNFLEFWQKGYGYLNDFWRLSNVAIFDAILVFIVISLSFAINFLTRQNLELEVKYSQDLYQSRSELIFKINEFFYIYKYPTNQQINKNVYMATKSLDKTLKSLNKIVSRLEKDIAKYPNSTKIVNEIKNLSQEVKRLQKK